MSNKRQFELKFDGRFADGQVLPVENIFDLSPFYLKSVEHSGRNFSFINPFQSRTLATLRDTLLPKLLSGEIRVKDAEKMVGKTS